MSDRTFGQMAEEQRADGLPRSDRGAAPTAAARLRIEAMPHPPKIPPEAELRRARSLLADLPGILWEADATSMAFTFVSDGVRDVLGYDASEWLSDPSRRVSRVSSLIRSLRVDPGVGVAWNRIPR